MSKSYVTIRLAAAMTIAAFMTFQTSQAQTSAAGKKAAAIHAGQDIFVRNCLQCHSVNEGQITFGPSLYSEMKTPHPKKNAQEVRAILKNGKGKMPSFQGKLSNQDIENLLAYLRTT